MDNFFSHIIEKLNLKPNKFPVKGNGEFIIFHGNGELRIKTFMVDGKRSGVAEWYYRTGQLKIKANYKDGELEGAYEEYRKNGQLNYKTNYIEGKEAVTS